MKIPASQENAAQQPTHAQQQAAGQPQRAAGQSQQDAARQLQQDAAAQPQQAAGQPRQAAAQPQQAAAQPQQAAPQQQAGGIGSQPRAGQQQQDSLTADKLKGKWQQRVGAAKVQWGKLTEDELLKSEGELQKLSGLVQERYAMSRILADKQVQEFLARSN